MSKKKKTVHPPVRVAILMGSKSDMEVMLSAKEILDRFGVGNEVRVLSAHRTPEETLRYAEQARGKGIKIIIAGAGGAAHLPGVIAAKTLVPVIGVPIRSKHLNGLDSLLSIVQMPAGVPVATIAIDGAQNAGLLAVQILALNDPSLERRLERYRNELREKVLAAN